MCIRPQMGAMRASISNPGRSICDSARGPFHFFSFDSITILTDWSIYDSDPIFSSDREATLRQVLKQAKLRFPHTGPN
jgi:hypothetical protein